MFEQVKIIRSNRKTLAVAVDIFGQVTVRAPKSCGEARIFAFLKDKQGWICARQAKAQGVSSRLPSENLDGFRFLLLGEYCTVLLMDDKRIIFDEMTRTLFVPRTNAQTVLVKWLKEKAKAILTATTASTATRMGVAYKSVSITTARTRWGSCSGDNALRYTFRLIYAPKWVIEYVVVHELAHIVQKNHSKAFWSVVEKYCPEWKQRRKWLKDNAILTRIF